MKKLVLSLIGVLLVIFTQAQCQAYFSYGQNGVNINFTDSSSTQFINYSTNWFWDFGDGNTSTLQHPSHIYSIGTYYACLTITYLDLVSMNTCVSTYCETIYIINTPSPSWDCDPINGCYDPGTGNGQYNSLANCQTSCITISWDCDPINGCYDPGTGLGQYSSFIHCDTSCNNINISSWNCDPVNGCYDPGTGNGQYTTLSNCQSSCNNTTPSYCDFITATGSQNTIIFQINNINTIIENWLTVSSNGDTLQLDNFTNVHNVNTYGMNYNSITTCISYNIGGVYYSCCETWNWNTSTNTWLRIGNTTSIDESIYTERKLIKIVDFFGRKSNKNSYINYHIYDNGTVEKCIIIN